MIYYIGIYIYCHFGKHSTHRFCVINTIIVHKNQVINQQFKILIYIEYKNTLYFFYLLLQWEINYVVQQGVD